MFGGLKNVFKRQAELTTQVDKTYTPGETIGSTGYVVVGGYIQDEETNKKISGGEKYKTFSNMLANAAIVGAGVRFFLNLIAKSEWSVKAANDSKEAQELAKFVESVMKDMATPWARIVRRSAMYKFYGFSIQEWTAKIRESDGRIGFFDIESRPQHTIKRWETDEYGRVLGVYQRNSKTSKEVYLPIEKLVYAVDDSISDSPEGLGIFRHLVQTIERLKRFEQLEGFGFETDLRGIPLGKAPLTQLATLVNQGTITEKQAADIKKPLEEFITNHIKSPKLGLLLDSDVYRSSDTARTPSGGDMWGMELLSSNSNSQEEVAAAINRLNHEAARLMGVENMLLGSDGRGTQALSRDKSQNFFLIIDSALQELTEAYSKSLIGPLWILNGFDDALKPTLKTEATQFRDIEEITGALRDLANAGAPLDPTDPVINEIRELLGLTAVNFEAMIRNLALLDGSDNNTQGKNNLEDDKVGNNSGDDDNE